jgi:hypothetical protein
MYKIQMWEWTCVFVVGIYLGVHSPLDVGVGCALGTINFEIQNIHQIFSSFVCDLIFLK